MNDEKIEAQEASQEVKSETKPKTGRKRTTKKESEKKTTVRKAVKKPEEKKILTTENTELDRKEPEEDESIPVLEPEIEEKPKSTMVTTKHINKKSPPVNPEVWKKKDTCITTRDILGIKPGNIG